MEHRPADRRDLITKVANVSYEPGAACPLFMKTLSTVFDGDEELIAFVLEAFAYSLTGSMDEQCFFVCYGSGSNGKTTVLRTIQDVAGDYGATTPADALLVKGSTGVPNDIARLKGVRFTLVSELPDGRRANEPLLKLLTGGDKATARFLYAEYFEFVPEAKIWITTNHKPKIEGGDHGIWRRVRLIPFTVTIKEEDQDRDLPKKLAEELPGILNLLLDSLTRLRLRGRLAIPEVVRDATAEYRRDMDKVGEFIDDFLEETPKWITTAHQMYEHYTEWCRINGEQSETQKWLTTRLREHGLEYVRRNHGGVFKNVSFRVTDTSGSDGNGST
jgi:putative DNA primase/helicase